MFGSAMPQKEGHGGLTYISKEFIRFGFAFVLIFKKN
jgi:hypothetical protein